MLEIEENAAASPEDLLDVMQSVISENLRTRMICTFACYNGANTWFGATRAGVQVFSSIPSTVFLSARQRSAENREKARWRKRPAERLFSLSMMSPRYSLSSLKCLKTANTISSQPQRDHRDFRNHASSKARSIFF